jgi:hypothetical protein
LAWLEDRAHKQIVTPSRGKCKTDSWITQHFTGSVVVARKVPLILYISDDGHRPALTSSINLRNPAQTFDFCLEAL